MSDYGFRKPLRGSNSRVRAEISTYPACLLVILLSLAVELEETKRHNSLSWFGPPCGVIPYSNVVWWIASWADDEQYRGRIAS